MDDINIPSKFLDSSYSMLERLREEAPGTYKHCQSVANICESIAIELGLNKDLLKCAALYHDIGKLNSPSYFSENQSSDRNPHDKLDPYVSYQIISRHVSDSVLYLLQMDDMPKEVAEIVSQHHGNSAIQAFFKKANTNDSEKHKFRYKCKVPQSTEAGILMIVDSTEAMVRALYDTSNTDKDFVKKTINLAIERIENDSQIDNLTIGTAKVVKKILLKELDGTYHKRVLYDDEDKKIISEPTIPEPIVESE